MRKVLAKTPLFAYNNPTKPGLSGQDLERSVRVDRLTIVLLLLIVVGLFGVSLLLRDRYLLVIGKTTRGWITLCIWLAMHTAGVVGTLLVVHFWPGGLIGINKSIAFVSVVAQLIWAHKLYIWVVRGRR